MAVTTPVTVALDPVPSQENIRPMTRRLVTAVFVCSLALPASALATEPADTAGGGLPVQVGPPIKVSSVQASKSGKKVTAKVRWDRALLARQARSERFTVRLLSGSKRQRHVIATQTRRSPKGTSETVTFKLNSKNAKLVKSAPRVLATATQQFDGGDADNKYEHNRVAISAMQGKRPFAPAKDCNPSSITPGADLSGCVMPGAQLAGANLAGVNLEDADLEGGSLAGANLQTTNLTATNLISVALVGAAWPPGEQAALTLPTDGEDIVDLIGTAKTSVDIVIYDFGGPNLVGQASNPGALMKAVQRGVNVRVILNSGQECSGTDAASQSLCAGQTSLDPLYATEAALKWASQNPSPGKTAGRYRVQFSSQNYQITHQKSVLIDTANADGSARTSAQMDPNSKIIVSTGNLQAFPVDWGQYETCGKWTKDASGDYTCTQYKVVNANYLSNPAGSCKGGTPSDCAVEWAARDFAIVVTNPILMERIAAVYGADQSCQDWNDAQIYRELLNSQLPDTWANGTLLADGSRYPQMATSAFYGGAPNPELQAQPQGNSRQRQLALIASAKKSLIVYNEEMADPDIANALVAAAKAGVQVRVVMATGFKYGTKTPTQNNYFDYLTSNGVGVNLLDRDAPPGVYYIHAKAIVADGTNGFMGSENFGYSSMNFNRELGLMLTNSNSAPTTSLPSVEGIAAITTAFEQDWSNPQAIAYKPQKPSPAPPLPPLTPASAYSGANMLCVEAPPGQLYAPQLPKRTSPTPSQ